MAENWTERKNPKRLERRIDFDNYDLTREFLDLAAEVSEKEGFYPDMNFGTKHVSMTIHPNDKDGEFEEAQLRFVEALNRFATSNNISAPLNTEYKSEDN